MWKLMQYPALISCKPGMITLFWYLKAVQPLLALPNSFCHWTENLKEYIYMYIREVLMISFQTFFVWALSLIVHTWNSSPLWSNLLQLQCSCCTIPTTSGRHHGSPLVWACQWPSSQPLSSPQLSHNNSLWV